MPIALQSRLQITGWGEFKNGGRGFNKDSVAGSDDVNRWRVLETYYLRGGSCCCSGSPRVERDRGLRSEEREVEKLYGLLSGTAC